jgi:hypothetical protein
MTGKIVIPSRARNDKKVARHVGDKPRHTIERVGTPRSTFSRVARQGEIVILSGSEESHGIVL